MSGLIERLTEIFGRRDDRRADVWIDGWMDGWMDEVFLCSQRRVLSGHSFSSLPLAWLNEWRNKVTVSS